jgi:low affinity Fe/Cu permease
VTRGLISRTIDSFTTFLGREYVFAAAVIIVVLWLLGGLHYGYGDTYQLIINTGTTIVTFVMIFAVQHTQNRETRAINAKLDAIVRVTQGISNDLVGIEKQSDKVITQVTERITQDCD